MGVFLHPDFDCCHWKGEYWRNCVWNQILKCSWCYNISYILYTKTRDVKFGPKVFFTNLSLTCALCFCFHLSAGFFFMTLLFCLHIQSSWLGTWLCLYLNPHMVSINSVWQPACSFHLTFCVRQGSRLTWGTALTHWIQILYRDPHGCIAVPMVTVGRWWIPWFFKGLQKRSPCKLKFAVSFV